MRKNIFLSHKTLFSSCFQVKSVEEQLIGEKNTFHFFPVDSALSKLCISIYYLLERRKFDEISTEGTAPFFNLGADLSSR